MGEGGVGEEEKGRIMGCDRERGKGGWVIERVVLGVYGRGKKGERKGWDERDVGGG